MGINWDAAASGLGALVSYDSARSQIKAQKQFAKKGIQWRVKDAKAAGLHPLYALGAQIPSFSPVMDATGSHLAQMGQDISRARKATLSPTEQKLIDLQLAQAQAGLDRTYAETALLQAERLKAVSGSFKFIPEPNTKESGGNAGSIFGGQTIDTTRQKVPANTVTPLAPDLPSTNTAGSLVAGVPAGYRQFSTPDGRRAVFATSSADLAEAMESTFESIPSFIQWYNANKAVDPNFDVRDWIAPEAINRIRRKVEAKGYSLGVKSGRAYRKARKFLKRQW